MRRNLTSFVASSVLTLALAFSASPALASPVQHFTFLATQAGNAEDQNGPLVVTCGPHTYTATSGTFFVVSRDSSTAAHITANDVNAVDQDGRAYRVLGAETYNDTAGRFTSKLMFVSQGGGIADSINVIARYRDGDLFVGFDQGTCGF